MLCKYVSCTIVGVSTLAYIIPETCDAIYNVLGDVYLRTPSTQEEWKAVAKGFYENWNYPNCIGAVDGKHVVSSAVMIFVQRARSSTPYL